MANLILRTYSIVISNTLNLLFFQGLQCYIYGSRNVVDFVFDSLSGSCDLSNMHVTKSPALMSGDILLHIRNVVVCLQTSLPAGEVRCF